MGSLISVTLHYCCQSFADAIYSSGFKLAVMKLQYHLNGFPRYRTKYIKTIEAFCPQEELDRYKWFSEHIRLPSLTLPAISLLIVTKRVYRMIELAKLSPRSSPNQEFVNKLLDEPHLRESYGNYTHLVQFGDCLLTNCTFFTRESYNILPLFSICNFEISSYFLPTNGWSLFTVISDICFTWQVILYGIIVSIFMYLYPCFDEFYMFLVSPISTQNLRLNQIKMHARDFYDSYLNYYFARAASLCNLKIQRQETGTREGSKNLTRSIIESESWLSKLNNIESFMSDNRDNLRSEVQKFREFDKKLNELSPQAAYFVKDCSTIFRTTWWQLKARKQTTTIALLTLIGLTLLLFILVYLLNLHYQLNLIDIAHLSNLVRSTGCFVKINRHYPEPVRQHANPVDFSFFSTNWTWVAWLEIIIIVVPSVVALSNVYGTFCSVYNDVNSMVNEQLDRILVVMELTCKFDTHVINSSEVNSKVTDPSRPELDFRELSVIHQRRVELNSKILYTLKSVFEFKFGHEANWKDFYDDEASPKSYVRRFIIRNKAIDFNNYCDLLAKIYVGNRCLFDTAEHLSIAYSVVIPIFLIWTHGFIILVVTLNKTNNQLNSLPFLFAISGVIANAVLISFPSSVYVESKKLTKLMLSLLACTTSLEDIRIKHARDLWIRQLGHMSWNKGIAVEVLGIPITYKSIIKLIVVSSSLIALWLN